MKSPFDIVKNLNSKNDPHQPEQEEFKKHFSPWIINKALANHKQSVLFANEMNMRHGLLDNDQMFDFYYYGIPRGNRFGKWRKKENDDDVAFVRDFYQVAESRAREYLRLLSKDQLDAIKQTFDTGGRAGKKK